MLSLLDSLMFAVPVYVDVPVQNIQGMGVRRAYDTVAGTETLSQTYHKTYVRGKTDATSGDWGKVWLQFDLADVWATYGKENLVAAKLKIWSENGTTRRFSVAGLSDGIDESWTMSNLSWTNAPGNNIDSGMTLDTTKIYGGTDLWRVQNSTQDAIIVDLHPVPAYPGIDLDQAASYESIDGPLTTANTNIKNFLLTDADGLITLIGYDHTNSSNQNWWTGIAGLYANDAYYSPSGLRCRDSVTLTLTFPPLGADNPSPYPGDIVESTLAQLSWTNPDPNDGVSAITPTVYFGTDPNRLQMNSITLASGATSVAISTFGGLQNLTKYYWVVDCADPSRTPPVIPGQMWSFRVDNNNPPVVGAGADQGVWMDPNLITVTLNATVTDDGLPIPPGTLIFLWTQISGPTSAVINSPTTKNTTVRLYEYGKYEFQLAVNDGGVYPDQTDTVVIAFGQDACKASHLLTGTGYYSGDFNTDCIVNLEDLAFLAAGWLNCTDTLDNCGI